jgi:hypothetical protein
MVVYGHIALDKFDIPVFLVVSISISPTNRYGILQIRLMPMMMMNRNIISDHL